MKKASVLNQDTVVHRFPVFVYDSYFDYGRDISFPKVSGMLKDQAGVKSQRLLQQTAKSMKDFVDSRVAHLLELTNAEVVQTLFRGQTVLAGRLITSKGISDSCSDRIPTMPGSLCLISMARRSSPAKRVKTLLNVGKEGWF